MRVILLNPASGLKKPLNRYIKYEPPVPPLGLASIAAALRREKAEVMVLDQVANGFTNEQVAEAVFQYRPEVVGVSCLTTDVTNTFEIVKQIREKSDDIILVLGNIHPTLFADEMLKNRFGDIIIRGEGEKVFSNLVRRLDSGAAYDDIKGISHRCNGTVKHNPDEDPIESLDDLPYPDWSLFELDRYSSCPMLMIKGRAVTIQASRGCPYSCFFCGQEVMNKDLRVKQTKRLVDEMEYLYDKYSIEYFGFVDSYFPMNPRQGFEFADELQKRGLPRKVRWFTETRVDKVDFELLKTLKKSGLYLVQYGFESGNQQVLDSMDKKMTLEQSRLAMQATKKAGLFSVGLFILGMPSENKQTCKQTIEFAKELDCDIAKFNIATPYPGSRFFNEYKGKITQDSACRLTSWLDWSSDSDDIVYAPEGLSKQQLVNLQRTAMYSFYMRFALIFRHLLKRSIPLKQLILGGFLLIKKYFRVFISRNET